MNADGVAPLGERAARCEAGVTIQIDGHISERCVDAVESNFIDFAVVGAAIRVPEVSIVARLTLVYGAITTARLPETISGARITALDSWITLFAGIEQAITAGGLALTWVSRFTPPTELY